MILADKIIRLRRKNGWSQEELAEKMNVSRQAVSKWESAQTVPDLEKILMLGALFGVTTDYLLKDELESEEFTSGEDSAIRRLTLAEANEYLALRKNASVRMAAATFLCIVSVIPLLILSALRLTAFWKTPLRPQGLSCCSSLSQRRSRLFSPAALKTLPMRSLIRSRLTRSTA